MNFYIRKNSTLPKLTVEVFIDDENSFWSSNDDFSASTITFNMKSEETGFYTIINKPVSVKVKRSTNSGPIKSYYLETQFTQKETSKLGGYISEFKIVEMAQIQVNKKQPSGTRQEFSDTKTDSGPVTTLTRIRGERR